MTYYLKEVVAARNNNGEEVGKNLRQAVRMDASLKGVAKNDIEFSKYDIKDIVSE